MSHLASVVLLNIYQEVAHEHSLKPPIIIAPKERSPVSDSPGEPFFSEQSYSQINHLFSHTDIPGRTSAKQKTPFGDDEHLLGGFEALSALRGGNGLESFPISPLGADQEKEHKLVPSALKMKLSLTPDTQKSSPVANKPKQVTIMKDMKDNLPKTRPVKKLERSSSLPVQNKTFEFEDDEEDEENLFEDVPQEGAPVVKNKRLNLGDPKARRHSTIMPMKGGADNTSNANNNRNNNKASNSNMNNNKNKNNSKMDMRKRRSIMRAASMRPKKSHFYYLSMSFADVDRNDKTAKKDTADTDDISSLPMNKNVNLICPPNDSEDDTPKKRKSRIEKDFELFKKRSYFSHFKTSSINSNNSNGDSAASDDLFVSETQSEPLAQPPKIDEIIESRSNSESDSGSGSEEEECMADKLEAALRKRELESSGKKFQRMSSSEVKPEPKPEPVQPKSTFGQNKPATHSRDNSASNPKSPKVPLATMKQQRGASVIDPNLATKPNISAPNTPQRPKTGVSSPTSYGFANKGFSNSKPTQKTEATSPENATATTTLAKSNVVERTNRLASPTSQQRLPFKSVEKQPVENKKQAWNPYTKKPVTPAKNEITSTATVPKSPLSKSGVTGATSPKNAVVDSTPKATEKQTVNKNTNGNELRSPDKSFTKNSPEVEELKYVHLKSFLEDGNQLDVSMEESGKAEPYDDLSPCMIEPIVPKPEPIEPKKNPSGVYLKAISKILEEPESPMILEQQPLEPVPVPKPYTEQSPVANNKSGYKGFQINPETVHKNSSTAGLEKKKVVSPPSLLEENPKPALPIYSPRTPKTITTQSTNSGPNTPSKAKARLAINQFQPKKPTVMTSYSTKHASMKESSSRLNSEADAPTEQLISPKDTKPIYTARSPLRNLLGQADTEKQSTPTSKLGQKSSLLNNDQSKTNKTHSEFRNISSLYKKLGNTSVSQPQQQASPSPRYQSVYNQLPRNIDGPTTKPARIASPEGEKLTSLISSPRLKDRLTQPGSFVSRNSITDTLQKSKTIASKGSPTNANANVNAEANKEIKDNNAQRSSLHRSTLSSQQKYRTGSPQYGTRGTNKWV